MSVLLIRLDNSNQTRKVGCNEYIARKAVNSYEMSPKDDDSSVIESDTDSLVEETRVNLVENEFPGMNDWIFYAISLALFIH